MPGEEPYFSVIVPDFHRSVSAHRREQCIESLLRSSWPDFEVLIYHDGPAPEPLQDFYRACCRRDSRIQACATPAHHNDWGHSLRDIGLRQARGRYIIHLNADNVLYPEAMQTLHAYSRQPLERMQVTLTFEGKPSRQLEHHINPEVLIFAIRMMGEINVLGTRDVVRRKDDAHRYARILPGWPPTLYNIDAMQLVATREIWQQLGGWHDKAETSDGHLLPAIARQHGYLVIPELLGEHW